MELSFPLGIHSHIGFESLRMSKSTAKPPSADPSFFPAAAERTPVVLVVDDEPLLRMMVADFLQECGFKVLEAASADEAVEILSSAMLTVDVLFSDIRLPGNMNGFALAKWTRAHHPSVAILLCSGDTKKADVAHELCEDAPFFSKPYDLNLVLTQIRQSMKKMDTKG